MRQNIEALAQIVSNVKGNVIISACYSGYGEDGASLANSLYALFNSQPVDIYLTKGAGFRMYNSDGYYFLNAGLVFNDEHGYYPGWLNINPIGRISNISKILLKDNYYTPVEIIP